MKEPTFFSRWSRRKNEARSPPSQKEPPAAPSAPSAAAAPAPSAPGPLPPLESLTPESDFAPFMQPKVDAGLKRQALKTLFQDPQFNVMDGLDVYVDDYSKPDPLPEGWLEKLNQGVRLGDYQDPRAQASGEGTPKAAEALEKPQEAKLRASALGEPAGDTSADQGSQPEGGAT